MTQQNASTAILGALCYAVVAHNPTTKIVQHAQLTGALRNTIKELHKAQRYGEQFRHRTALHGVCRRKLNNAMPYQRVPFTVQAEVRYVAGTIPFVNTLYFQKPGGYSETDVAEIADYVDVWASSGVIQLLSNTVSYTYTTVRGLDAENDFLVVADANGPVTGGSISPRLPMNVAICVSLRTGLTGRSARGRNYIGGLPEAEVSLDTISSNLQNLIVTEYNALRTGAALIGWTQVVVSRYANGVKRATAVVFPTTAPLLADARVDTQRKRLDNE